MSASEQVSANRLRAMMRVVFVVAGITVAGSGDAVWAQQANVTATYPSRPVTVVVPYAAGGPVDVMARIVSQHMSKTLGQSFMVENVTGAGGTIAVRRAFRADPDGYTLNVGNLGSHAAAYGIYGPEKAGYDPREFEPIGLISSTPIYLVVRNDFPAQNLQEFVAFAKANPGKITNGHGGVGGTLHLACTLFSSVAGIQLTPVAYRGSAPAMNDLISGQIDSICDSAPSALPQLQAGKIRALVVAEEKRVPFSPNIPASPETSTPQFLATGWNAMFAPKGTPASALDRLRAALRDALANPEVQKRIVELGGTVPQGGLSEPDGLRAFVREEVERWGKVVAAAGIKP